jgi:hypothetical protein
MVPPTTPPTSNRMDRLPASCSNDDKLQHGQQQWWAMSTQQWQGPSQPVSCLHPPCQLSPKTSPTARQAHAPRV